MSNLQKKVSAYTEPQKVQALGLYPYFRVLSSDQDTEVIINGKKVLMFGSNSYMGLTNHPKIKEAAKKAVDKYGSGCAGSRFLNGTIDLHIELEDALAKFVRKEGALVYSTGFQVNLGVPSCLLGRHDYIIIDECVHASLIEGCRLAFAKILKYAHNDMADLEAVLKDLPADKIKMIITDGVFSMEGDIAKLPDICKLGEKYGATVYVDDAHSIGVLGKTGAGTAEHFGLTDKVELIMGTFSKSLASLGGFIAGSKEVINFLKHHSRTLIFSASIPPASAASALAALEIIKAEPQRLKKLWDNTHYSMKCLREAGFDIGHTETPVIPIYIRDDLKTFTFTRDLMEEGVFVNPIVTPAVKSTDTLVRFSLMATHSQKQIDFAIDKIKKVAKKLDILSPAEVQNNHRK